MPLIINDKIEDSTFRSFADFAVKHPQFKESAENFCKKPVRRVERSGVLYVTQREYATVTQGDENITVLGSEDATTCHIVVLRHTGSGVTSLGHFDGDNTDKGLQMMVASVNHLSKSACKSGRFELHLFGGFIDDNQTSQRLTTCILGAIQNQNEPIHLCSACVTGFNDTVERGLHKPIIYGIGINIQDGEVYPALFLDKGPDECVRHARIFGGIRGMVEIYNSTYKELRIMPYDYQNGLSPEYLKVFRDAPEEFILKNLSTSPHCEPPDFVSNTRAAFDHILTHPEPLITVFPQGKPRVYKRLYSMEHWTRVIS